MVTTQVTTEKRGLTRPSRLSAAFVRTVREPGRYGDGGRGSYGLSLLVRPGASGGLTKTWVQRLQINGRPTHIGLGPLALVSLGEARELAIENAKAVRAGVNPLVDRRRREAVPSFRDAAERVIALHVPNWKDGSRTAKIWHARLREYAYPTIGHLKVDVLTTADVLGVLTPIWSTRRETARKLRQYVDSILSWCVAEGHLSSNPAEARVINAALPRAGGQRNHQRALAYADVPAALARIEASDATPTTKLAVRFLTLTACRSSEVRGARWDEVELHTATWSIPASRMKSPRPHRVPLSRPALDVLDRARGYRDKSGLLFPSATGKVLSDNTLSKLFRENDIAGTPHGMRSSFRVWAAETGVERTVAEMCLAHEVGSATETAYRRTDLFEARRSVMEDWARACEG